MEDAVRFKAGDRVRIVSGSRLDLKRMNINIIQYYIGDILELVNDRDTDSPYYIGGMAGEIVYICFFDEQGVFTNNNGQTYFRIKAECVELVTSEKHKCHCPPQNFHWNGIGCQCGGE